METQSKEEVIEAVLMTALCSAAALLVGWIGKRFMGMAEHGEIHIHNYMGEMPLEEEEDD